MKKLVKFGVADPKTKKLPNPVEIKVRDGETIEARDIRALINAGHYRHKINRVAELQKDNPEIILDKQNLEAPFESMYYSDINPEAKDDIERARRKYLERNMRVDNNLDALPNAELGAIFKHEMDEAYRLHKENASLFETYKVWGNAMSALKVLKKRKLGHEWFDKDRDYRSPYITFSEEEMQKHRTQ